jgi:hypothetical protein
MIKEYGKCGKACEICMYLGLVCKGCLVENENNPDLNCVIYDCAIKINIQSCLSCLEYPCDLVKSLSWAYCPVHVNLFLQDAEVKKGTLKAR